MTHYYFHLRNGGSELIDPEGMELANLQSAKSEALRQARSIMSYDILQGFLDLDQRIDIENVGGMLVHSQEFRQALIIGAM